MTIGAKNVCIVFCTFYFTISLANAQFSRNDKIINSLNFGSSLPANLCAGRSIVLYESGYTARELQEAQTYFQQSGIDAVLYVDVDYVFSGADPAQKYSDYFSSRRIKYLIFLQKAEKGFQIIIAEYNGTKEFIDKQSSSWKLDDTAFFSLLQAVYRLCISTQKRTNLLINDEPEMQQPIQFYRERNERFSNDVRTLKIAIPRMGNDADDKVLDDFLKEKFLFKYQLVDPLLTEKELQEKEFRLILRFVNARGDVARTILGYDAAQPPPSLVTNYIAQGEQKVKTVPSKDRIYKFYFKSLENGSIFLGTRWDADETWLDALRNHIVLMQQELKP